MYNFIVRLIEFCLANTCVKQRTQGVVACDDVQGQTHESKDKSS